VSTCTYVLEGHVALKLVFTGQVCFSKDTYEYQIKYHLSIYLRVISGKKRKGVLTRKQARKVTGSLEHP